MTQQELDALHQSLLNTAANIQTYLNLRTEKTHALEDKREAREMLEAQILASIAGNNILYKNADQRRAAFIEARAFSVEYQAARTAERAAEQEKNETEAGLEFQRKTYRADELLLLYHANHRTP